VSGSYDRTLRLWNLDTGAEERRLVGADSIISNVVVSPDGRRLLSTGGPVVLVWDVASGRIERPLGNDDRGGHYLQFFADSRKAISAGADREVHLWNLDTGEELAALGEHSHAIEAGGLSADERHFLAGCLDKTAWLWDLTSRQELRRLSFPHRVYRVVPTPMGFWVACNDDQGGISVCDFDTQRELFRIEGHQAAVWGLEFTADRRRALTGSRDGTVRLWELPGDLT
jgi:WD40 repeat protein